MKAEESLESSLVRRALAAMALKVVDENPGPPTDSTDAGWYQGNVKLIACENRRSAFSSETKPLDVRI